MTTAAVAVLMPLLAPTTSFAGGPGKSGVGGGGAVGGARGAVAAPSAAMGGGGGRGAPSFAAAPNVATGNGGWRSGNVAVNNGGGGWNGGWRDHDRDRHRGFIPGAIAGAAIGGAFASNAYGYGGPDYDYGPTYDDSYYDSGYVDNGAVAVAPGEVGVDSNYCAQRYRTYDPASGTYLGYDGLRHPCP